jgi:hypothetical protein
MDDFDHCYHGSNKLKTAFLMIVCITHAAHD